jgi:hypothetical protein
MTSLFEAVNATAVTANGAVTNSSSLNKNVDLFFLAGASRGKDITPTFVGALVEDSEVAIRVLEWVRDARGGAGERETFRKLFAYVLKNEPALASRLLLKVPELGRWDDVFVVFGTPLEREALRLIAAGLKDASQSGLCAKWMPRQGAEANKIRSYLKLTPKEYRKLLVGLSNTVEQKMCAREWDGIVYPHIPSVAAGRYQKAFLKHDPKGYADYKAKLVTGEAKINAGAVYPYDVIRSLNNGDKVVANAQWAALPNYLEGSDENIMPVVDVSGSMGSVAAGSVTALDVAISLGLYVSERMGGVFKDQFVTFSGAPEMLHLKGNLQQRYDQMARSNWAMNTDLGAVFKLILNAAVKSKVDQKEMPTKLVILSDMEFDACVTTGSTQTAGRYSSGGSPVSVSAMEFIEAEYTAAGYKIPQVVFWNLNGRSGNSPVTYNKVGAALISGFSPSIMKSVLGGEEMTPISIMLKTVMIKKYDF